MAEVVPAGHVPVAAEARSYLDDGRVVVWRPPSTPHAVAIDAERRRTPPPHIAAQAVGDVWVWWTTLEVLCKLLDVPVLDALKHGLPKHHCLVRTVELDDLVITFGVRPAV